VNRLAREGATTFVEVGPGKVLTGLLRRILEGVRGHSVEDPDSLQKTLAAVRPA
jgi:[acyl-carrier-protein] S-malonyltransferase